MQKPQPFGKYYLLERINVGGMAEVFKAKAFGVEGFERLVAVKRILPSVAQDEEFIRMFIDEAKIAVRLNHANIAQIFDLGMADGSYYIALEHVPGKDLRTLFEDARKTRSPLTIPQACYIILKICEGLDYAHNKRDAHGRELHIVHRDVSPQNVLISFEGEVKLIDFGIAKAAGRASRTKAGILKGKFGYMSPEQVRGLPLDRRSDIFSLGILLYELLTMERLFVGESDFATLEKVRNVEVIPPSTYNRSIPEDLENTTLKALSRDPDDRYQTAADLHDALQRFLFTVGLFFSRKDLADYMKDHFAEDMEREHRKLDQYRHLTHPPTPPPRRRPTPLPPQPGMAPAAAPGALSSARPGAAPPTRAPTFPPTPPPPPGPSSAHVPPPGAPHVAPPPPSPAPRLATGGYGYAAGPGQDGPTLDLDTDDIVAGIPDPGAGAYEGYRAMSREAGGAYVPELSWDEDDDETSVYDRDPAFVAGEERKAITSESEVVWARSLRPREGAPAEAAPPQRAGGRLQPAIVLGLFTLACVALAATFVWYFVSVRGATGSVVLETVPERVEILVNDQRFDVGRTPVTIQDLPLGSHQLTVRAPGYREALHVVDVAGGAPDRLRVVLEKGPPPTGAVRVVTDPPGARVLVDGRPREGMTPLVVSGLDPGSHTVAVESPPHLVGERVVSIAAGATTDVAVPLSTRSVSLRITSTPPGALFRIEGPEGALHGEGATPDEVGELLSGVRYTVHVTGEGRRPWSRIYTPVGPGPHTLDATLDATPAATPAATVDGRSEAVAAVRPAAAAGARRPGRRARRDDVRPDDVRRDEGRRDEGRRDDALRDDALRDAPVRRAPPPRIAPDDEDAPPALPPPAPLVDNGPPAATPPPVEYGQLNLNSKPWARVYIDGRDTGQSTPLLGERLPAGRRRITLINERFGLRKEYTVDVRPGRTSQLIVDLQ